MRKTCADGSTPVVPDTGTAANANDGTHCYTPAEEARTVTDWNTGLVVSMSGVSVGGSYRVQDHDNAMDDTTQYDIGVKYGEGPWAISANFGNQSQDSEMIDTDFSRLMATYNLALESISLVFLEVTLQRATKTRLSVLWRC